MRQPALIIGRHFNDRNILTLKADSLLGKPALVNKHRSMLEAIWEVSGLTTLPDLMRELENSRKLQVTQSDES